MWVSRMILCRTGTDMTGARSQGPVANPVERSADDPWLTVAS